MTTGVRVRGLVHSTAGIVLGTVLVLALVACGKSQVYREAGAGRASSTAARSTGKPGKTVTVRRGDSLYKLGRIHGVSALDIAFWNGIAPPYTIYPGQRLKLYPSAANKQKAPALASTRTSPSRPAKPPTPPAAANKQTVPAGASASTPPSRPAKPPTPPAVQPPERSPFNWRWPTEGQVVTRFSAGEATRQGVDISGRSGQPVRASADGLVVYSGSGLVGYGELVIIKHDEQWLTAYGHNRARLVNEGARVKAGEQIAEMGRTGAARDMLHFEIRYNGRPVDPLRYLPAR